MKQLVARPIINASVGGNDNLQTALSPDGKWLFVCAAQTGAARLWKWNGNAYEEVAFNATGIIYNAAWTPDMAYMVLVTNVSGQTAQLRSFNPTTGETTVLGGIAGVPNASFIQSLNANDFICLLSGNVTGALLRAIRINRANNTLSSYAVANVSNTALSYNTGIALRTKNAVLVEQRNNTANNIVLLRPNEGSGGFDELWRINLVDSERAFYLGVNRAETMWHRPGRTIASNGSRMGTINAAGTELTMVDRSVYPGPSYSGTKGIAGIYSSFLFSSTALIVVRNSLSPYGLYEVYDPVSGSFVANTGQITTEDSQMPGGAQLNRAQGAIDRAANAKVIAMVLASNSPRAIVTYEERETNESATIIASAPMADAFVSARDNDTANLVADVPMAVAILPLRYDDTLDFVADAPMADAFISGIENDKHDYVAVAPMADAHLGLLVNEQLDYVADAPMAYARASLLVNYESDFGDLAPMADARISALTDRQAEMVVDVPMASAIAEMPVNAIGDLVADAPMAYATLALDYVSSAFEALAPMADAWVQASDSQVIAAGIAPMAEAIFVATGSFVDALAVAPMADANFDIPNVNVQGFEGLAPMADAFMTASTSVISFLALAPMADATLDIGNTYAAISSLAPMADAQVNAQRYTTGDAFAIAPMANAIFDTEMPVTTIVAQVPMADAFTYMGRQGRAAFSVFVIRKG